MHRFRLKPDPVPGSHTTLPLRPPEVTKTTHEKALILSWRAPRLTFTKTVPCDFFPRDILPRGFDPESVRKSCLTTCRYLLILVVKHSIYGQAPSSINPDRETIEYAMNDCALLSGLLALACLGRDLHQEIPPSKLCLELKGRTIKHVRERVGKDADSMTVGTIGAIAALAAFDMLECLGDGQPRPDNMTFLHLAVAKHGGLQGLVKNIPSTRRRYAVLERIILWLDLSYAVLDKTPNRFAFHNSPVHLESTALHHVSMHLTPLRMVFAELSELSQAVDRALSDEELPPDPANSCPGDRVFSVEQYVTSLDPHGLPQDVLEIVRLATFLYSARYIRQFTSNSRVQMGLSQRLQVCLKLYFQRSQRYCEDAFFNAPIAGVGSTGDTRAILLWSTTIAAASSCSFREIWKRDHEVRRAVWVEVIDEMMLQLAIRSISEAEAVVKSLTCDTAAARSDRRALLRACGLSP